jgi:hypothetical protein
LDSERLGLHSCGKCQTCLAMAFLFVYWQVWTPQGLVFARQAFYHLSHTLDCGTCLIWKDRKTLEGRAYILLTFWLPWCLAHLYGGSTTKFQ